MAKEKATVYNFKSNGARAPKSGTIAKAVKWCKERGETLTLRDLVFDKLAFRVHYDGSVEKLS